jgi:hypothetical protein
VGTFFCQDGIHSASAKSWHPPELCHLRMSKTEAAELLLSEFVAESKNFTIRRMISNRQMLKLLSF